METHQILQCTGVGQMINDGMINSTMMTFKFCNPDNKGIVTVLFAASSDLSVIASCHTLCKYPWQPLTNASEFKEKDGYCFVGLQDLQYSHINEMTVII